MAGERILRTGNGAIDFRFEMAGIPYQFVTADWLVGMSGSYERINGLLRTGFQAQYNVNFASAKLSANSMTFAIRDLGQRVTQLFTKNPDAEVRLVENASATDSILYVDGVTNFATGAYYLGQETIYAVSTATGPDRVFATRGMYGSEALAYSVDGNFGDRTAWTLINQPASLIGRRCSLWMYEAGDDRNGPGRLVWRGFLSSDLMLEDYGTYSLSAQPVTEVLNQEIGGGFGEEMKPRGIYHPTGLGFTVMISEMNGLSTVQSLSEPIVIEGFDETLRDMVDRLNEQVAFSCSAWTVEPRFGITPNGGLMCYFNTGPSNYTIGVSTWNGLRETQPDGRFGNIIPEEYFEHARPQYVRITETAEGFPSFESSAFVTTTSANFQYAQLPLDIAAVYPSAITRYVQNVSTLRLFGTIPDPVPYPANRVYLDAPYIPAYTNSVVARTEEEGEDYAFLEGCIFNVDTVNSAQRYIELSRRSVPSGLNYMIRDTNVTFDIACNFVTTGTMADFFQMAMTRSVQYSSEGIFPNISPNDIDTVDIERVLASSQIPAYAKERGYVFAGNKMKVEDVFAEDCKLAGVYPTVNMENGKLTVRMMKDVSPTEFGLFQITTNNAITKEIPRWYQSGEDILNTVQLKTGYNPVTEEYNGPEFNGEWKEKITEQRKVTKLTMEPMSQDVMAIDFADIDSILWKKLAFFGRKRRKVENLSVPLTVLTASVGTGVSVTLPNIPDMQGGRGIVAQPGYISRMEIDFDQGVGNVDIILTDLGLAGYAPTAVVRSLVATGSAPTVTFQLSASRYSPTGVADIDWFTVGDKVQLMQWNSWEPRFLTGTITTKDATTNNMGITIAGLNAPTDYAWLSGGARVMLPAFSSSNMTVYQQKFCFVGTGSVAGASQKTTYLRYYGA